MFLRRVCMPRPIERARDEGFSAVKTAIAVNSHTLKRD
jgi:hypothetical protein